MFFLKIGPDPDFPFFNENEFFSFNDPHEWERKVILLRENKKLILPRKNTEINRNIIAISGNLSPGMLLSAYEQGIFPWYNPTDPVLWQSPDPRFVIFPEKLHVSSSMRKVLKNNDFDIAFNKNFSAVIRGCLEVFRPDQKGSWITNDIIEAYIELHRLGFAHSAEARRDGELVGGCYGVLLGRVFFGESMFTKESNASKAAFLTLVQKLFEQGLLFIDCQTPTRHLASLGGEEISREGFLALLKRSGASRTQSSISLK